eukprot:PhM_4_TR8844/c0_g3_i1/m.55981/K15376/GPHN; gephyrin
MTNTKKVRDPSLTCGVITVSDRCSAGTTEDTAGPSIANYLLQHGASSVLPIVVVPDEPRDIKATVLKMAHEGGAKLVLTTGGTGFTPRDGTPECVQSLFERDASALASAVIAKSCREVTLFAALSRCVCGVMSCGTIVLTLPGSRKGALENLEAALPALIRAVHGGEFTAEEEETVPAAETAANPTHLRGLQCAVVDVTSPEEESYESTATSLIADLVRCGGNVRPLVKVEPNITAVRAAVLQLQKEGVRFLVTCGGTGFGPKGVTPTAVSALFDRDASSVVHGLMANLPSAVLAGLSRVVCGLIGEMMVLTLPSKRKSLHYLLDPIYPLLPYMVCGDSPPSSLETVHEAPDLRLFKKLTVAVLAIGKSGTQAAPAAIASLLLNNGADVLPIVECANDVPSIQKAVLGYVEKESADLILTVGSTGFRSSDVAPEAIAPLLERKAQSIVVGMLCENLMGCLCRAQCGTIRRATVLTLPGGARGSTENLRRIMDILPHATRHNKGEGITEHPIDEDGDDIADACEEVKEEEEASAPAVPIAVGSVVSRARVSEFPMLPMDEALNVIIDKSPKPATVRRPVQHALGAVLAEDVKAAVNIPPYRASIKDGYAVVTADGEGVFPVAGSSAAGQGSEDPTLAAGHVFRVTTGSAVPDGADAVIQVEDTELVDADAASDREISIRIKKAAKVGQDIRPVGTDMKIGQLVLPTGTTLGAVELALLCSVGVTEVLTYGPVVVGVLSTGDELADATDAARRNPKTIFDSNRPMLMSALKSVFPAAEVVDLGICRDDTTATGRSVHHALYTRRCDVVLSTGGVSMGEFDVVKGAVRGAGGTIHFGRVNMKPGKPTTFATIPRPDAALSDAVWIGLPGNPVSAFVCFHLFAVPVVRKLLGVAAGALHHPVLRARVTEALPLDRERPEYHRCRIEYKDGELVAVSTGPTAQASHRLLSASQTNGLIKLPVGDAASGRMSVDANSLADVLIIDKL